jgi:hypothetical protein
MKLVGCLALCIAVVSGEDFCTELEKILGDVSIYICPYPGFAFHEKL